MKRRLFYLLIALLVITAAGCSRKEQPIAVVQPVETGTITETAEGNCTAQLRCIAENADTWLVSEGDLVGDYHYAVADLNGDGCPELIRGHQFGSSFGETVTVFRVNDSGDGVIPLAAETDGLVNPNVVRNWLWGFTDGETCIYPVEEIWGGPVGGGIANALMTVGRDTLRISAVSRCELSPNPWGGTTKTFYRADNTEISEEAYERLLYEAYGDWQYFEICPQWAVLRPGDDVEDFVRNSWAGFLEPVFPEYDSGYTDAADLLIYFNEPGSAYSLLDDDVLPLSTGFEDYSRDRLRVIAGRKNLTVSLEVLNAAQLTDWYFGSRPSYTVLSFTPTPGRVYEIPVMISEGIPMCRISVSDGVNTAKHDLCYEMEDGFPIHYQELELRCLEPQIWYPEDYTPITALARAFAGWAVEAGEPARITDNFWDVVSNAISLNMDSFAVKVDSFFTVPDWLVEDYVNALFAGLPWDIGAVPEMGPATAVRPRQDTDEAYVISPNLYVTDRSVELENVYLPMENQFSDAWGDMALEFVVHGQVDNTVIVFLTRTDANVFGWYISYAVLAMG